MSKAKNGGLDHMAKCKAIMGLAVKGLMPLCQIKFAQLSTSVKPGFIHEFITYNYEGWKVTEKILVLEDPGKVLEIGM